MKVLTLNDRAVQISAEIFPVHSSLVWRDGANDTEIGDRWDGQRFVSGRVQIPLIQLKQEKRRELNEARDAAMLAPVVFGGSLYDVSPQIRNDLTSAVSFLHIAGVVGLPDVPPVVSWRDADNVDHDLTETELLGLAAAMFAQVQAAHITARDLKDQVNAATSAAQVRGIDWP